MKLNQPKLYIFYLLALIAILAGAGYFAGQSMLPSMILASYEAKDCKRVDKLGTTYAQWYSTQKLDALGISAKIEECRLYETARQLEYEKGWDNSLKNYQTYLDSYPQGKFAKESYEHSALILSKIAREQQEKQEYELSIQNLEAILTNYPDAVVAKKTGKLLMLAYIAWGDNFLAQGQFGDAEIAYLKLKEWAQKHSEARVEKEASQALAKTYLEWAKSIQADGGFEKTKAKLEQVIAADPLPDVSNSLTSQAQIMLSELQVAQADSLLAQKDIKGAIQYYEAAVTSATPDHQAAIKDKLAGVYALLADELLTEEDFLGALGQVALAENNAGTGEMREKVAESKEAIIQAFSASSGEQAKKAMDDFAKATCEGTLTDRNSMPPIFGLDKTTTGAVQYGLETLFVPVGKVAQTPGQLHFVVCANEIAKQLERASAIIVTLEANPTGYKVNEIGRETVSFIRVQYIWEIKVFQVNEEEPVFEYTFSGLEPENFNFGHDGNVVRVHQGEKTEDNPDYPRSSYGPKPNINDVAKWVAEVLK